MNWPIVELGQLLTVQPGFAFKSSCFHDTEGMPLIRIRDLGNENTQIFYNGPYKGDFVVRNGDFLIGMDGDFVCHEWRGAHALLNQRVCRLTNFDERVVHPRFIRYRIQSALDAIHASTSFVTVKHISGGQISSIGIELPPLSEQARIVELLDEADRLRKLRREADAKVARILPALFLRMFGNPASNPKGWPVEPLATIVDTVNRRNPAVSPDKLFVYVDIAGVDGEQGVIRSTRKLLGHEAPSRARQVIKWRDTLVSTVRPYLRATALVPKELDGEIASTGFCVLRPVKSYGFAWLYQITRQKWFMEQLNLRARGASYPAVTDADIMQLPVPIPSDEACLRRFDDEYEKFFDTLKLIGSGSERVAQLFDLLLERAFTGQLTAKWREAHMKELLAEMREQARVLNLPLPKEPGAAT